MRDPRAKIWKRGAMGMRDPRAKIWKRGAIRMSYTRLIFGRVDRFQTGEAPPHTAEPALKAQPPRYAQGVGARVRACVYPTYM